MPKSKENMYATDTLMDERELVLRLIDGDEDAFCELYAAYKNRLLYFAMKFVKSREFAEDIFQDAFTVVWQSRRFINPDASFSSYLYTRSAGSLCQYRTGAYFCFVESDSCLLD